MAYPKLEASIPFSSSVSLTISENGGSPVAVTVLEGSSNGYLLSTDNGSTTALLRAITSGLESNASVHGSYTLALSNTTGKVTIEGSGVSTFTITWTNTILRDVLGFTGNLSGALTYTGTEHAEYLWLPEQFRAGGMSPLGAQGKPISDLTVTVSPSGYHKQLSAGDSGFRYVDTMEFHHVLGLKIWDGLEETQNESFEVFFQKALSVGRQIRFYPDKDDEDVLSVDYVAVPDSQGSWEMPVQPSFQDWTGSLTDPTANRSLWNVRFNVIKYQG